MFFRILSKSFMGRKSQIAIALVAVIIGAALPSAMLTVSMDVTENVNTEFRKFGANLLLVPRSDTIDIGIGAVNFGSVTEQRYINETELWKVKTISWQKNILGYVPYLYQVVRAEANGKEQRVVLAGTWFQKETVLEDGSSFKTGARKVNGWWDVEGMWPSEPDIDDGDGKNLTNATVECIIGASVAEKMGLGIGDKYSIRYNENEGDTQNDTSMELEVVGIVSTGDSEDNTIFIDLLPAQMLSGRPYQVHTVQVSALCTGCPVDTFAREIEEKMPYVEAKTVKQLTSVEMSVLNKIEHMMFLVTVVALIASVLGVSTTMTTSVLTRKKEIGLMKSLGAENHRVVTLFLAEAALIGILGGLAGFFLGYALAQFVGESVFNSSVAIHPVVLPIALGISVSVALLASILPVRKAVRIGPAIVLRGE